MRYQTNGELAEDLMTVYGTTDAKVIEAEKNLIQSNFSNAKMIESNVELLSDHPEVFPHIIERRFSSSMYDINPKNIQREIDTNKIFTDLVVIKSLMNIGYDLSKVKVNLNCVLGQADDIHTIPESLEEFNKRLSNIPYRYIPMPDEEEKQIDSAIYAKRLADEVKKEEMEQQTARTR